MQEFAPAAGAGSALEDVDQMMGAGVTAAPRLPAATPVGGLIVGEARCPSTGCAGIDMQGAVEEDAAMEEGEPAQPSGIVTFVMTDIEGSTRLLRGLGIGFAPLRDRHNELLREVWRTYGGHEMETAGDSFMVAFGDAADAVTACATAQRAIAAEPWPGVESLRVRMGVHSGLASPHHGGYVALAAHQTARVASAGHGGQVLVSEDAASRLGRLPGLDLEPLGRYRVRDFDGAVRLFQLRGQGLVERFPAVRAVPAEGHNMVRPATAFFGRADDVARVRARIAAGRILTLVGPGGVGKTRLAIEAALGVVADWADGVWLVDLASLDSAALLPEAFAAVLVMPPSPGRDRWSAVLEHLASSRSLLVVDNCEPLLGACADRLVSLRDACPSVAILATSIEPLQVAGEQVERVSPLGVPIEGQASGADAAASPAVQLFLDRARAVRPELELHGPDLEAAVSICRHLDGLPLAIEIAAAHAGHLSLDEILAGLADRFRLLRSQSRSLPERQRTMEGVLDWSYRLLDTGERTALRRLSWFAGSFSLEGALAALGADLARPELVWALVDKSLVVAHLTDNETRYRLLETVRVYAARAAEAANDTLIAARSAAAWYLARVGAGHAPDRQWISEVREELDNLRAVASVLAAGDQPVAQELAWTVGRFHDAVQQFRTGILDVGRLVDELPARSPARVALLTLLADLHLRLGEVEPAQRLVAEADGLRSAVGPARWDDVGVERTRGEIARRSGDLRGAVAIADETLARPISPRGRGRMANLRGIALLALGDRRGAMASFQEELAAYEQLGFDAQVASANGNVAEVALQLGEVVVAAVHQRACLALAVATGQPLMVAYSLMVAARLAGTGGDWPAAASFQATAEEVLRTTGNELYDTDRAAVDALLDQARGELGPIAFEQASERGRSMPLPAAAAAADTLFSALAGASAS
jgi:predicted ATPase/class 3 adenylate cyclase